MKQQAKIGYGFIQVVVITYVYGQKRSPFMGVNAGNASRGDRGDTRCNIFGHIGYIFLEYALDPNTSKNSTLTGHKRTAVVSK